MVDDRQVRCQAGRWSASPRWITTITKPTTITMGLSVFLGVLREHREHRAHREMAVGTFSVFCLFTKLLVSCPRGSRNKWRGRCGVKIQSALSKPRDARENLIGGLGPHERFRTGVMRIDEVANRRFELGDAAMHAATQLFGGEFGEPALYQVEPRPVGRCEMDVKARPFGEPVADQRRLVRPVIVHDQVHIELLRHRGVDRVEELPELDGPMATVKFGDQLRRFDIERGEEGRRPVAFVLDASVARPVPAASATTAAYRSSA